MKKPRVLSVLLALLLAAALALPVQAKTFTGGDWNVTFTRENGMESDFRNAEIDDLILGMQPGDEAIVTLALHNRDTINVNWYMTNKVLRSLEDTRDTASGGAYTYRLVYTDPAGADTILFDSDTVGGSGPTTAGEGLNATNKGLADYFFLDAMPAGQSGKITLTVALDGETQGNGYQDTLADLQMQFAIELAADPNAPGAPGGIVKTGDENILPYVIAAAVSGGLLLAYAVWSVRSRRQKRKGR